MNISKETMKFLDDLRDNNSRDWFNKNRDRYDKARGDFNVFVDALISGTAEFDPGIGGLSVKDCTFRINRDVRFSKDKSPYKIELGAIIRQGGRKSHSAGYYFRIIAGGYIGLGGGLYDIDARNLDAVRKNISNDASGLRKILGNSEFVSAFGGLYRNELKTAPRGYPRDHPDVDLLRLKSFFALRDLNLQEKGSEDLLSVVLDYFRILKPLNDYLNIIIM